MTATSAGEINKSSMCGNYPIIKTTMENGARFPNISSLIKAAGKQWTTVLLENMHGRVAAWQEKRAKKNLQTTNWFCHVFIRSQTGSGGCFSAVSVCLSISRCSERVATWFLATFYQPHLLGILPSGECQPVLERPNGPPALKRGNPCCFLAKSFKVITRRVCASTSPCPSRFPSSSTKPFPTNKASPLPYCSCLQREIVGWMFCSV